VENSDGSPPAPSPAAASTKGWPEAAGVPVAGVNVFVFTGGVVMPLLKVRLTPAAWVTKVSRSIAWTVSTCAPST